MEENAVTLTFPFLISDFKGHQKWVVCGISSSFRGSHFHIPARQQLIC